MTSLILREEIKKYRRTLTKAQRAATYRRRPFRMHYPHSSEAKIKSVITKFFAKYTDKVYSFFAGRIPPSVDRRDGLATEFQLFMNNLEEELTFEVSGGIDLSPFVNRILEFMLRYKEEEIAEYMKSITGREFFGTTEWWAETKRQWIDLLNRSVSKNIIAYTDKIRDIVYNAIKNNESRVAILEAIKNANESLDEKKAAFIARDLTGKLNGTIEKNLQISIGVSTYLWQTMRDERVRGRPGGVYAGKVPSHWAMESLLCDWNNPTVVSRDLGRTWEPRAADMPYLHPGEDWLCRCSGSPVLLSLLKEIDRQLYGESILNG